MSDAQRTSPGRFHPLAVVECEAVPERAHYYRVRSSHSSATEASLLGRNHARSSHFPCKKHRLQSKRVKAVSLVVLRLALPRTKLFTWRRLVVEGAAAGSGEQVVLGWDKAMLQEVKRSNFWDAKQSGKSQLNGSKSWDAPNEPRDSTWT
jgi:hypothetical protein